MSFTTDIFQEILGDIGKAAYKHGQLAMRMISYKNGTKIAFAVVPAEGLRSIFISVGSTIPTCVFPKWHGVSIQIVQLPDYDANAYFVKLGQLPASEDYIYEIVAEDLRLHTEKSTSLECVLSDILAVLLKWKTFFQSEKEILMPPERQQGLYGELLFLKWCLQNIGCHSVAQWSGANDETHDFYFGNHAVEIKTSSKREPYSAHISSEYQLDCHDVKGKLFLLFYALRKSQSSGETLPHLVAYIDLILESAPYAKEQFSEKLKKYGYMREASDLYTTGFFIRDNYSFVVDENFPCITNRMVDTAVFGIEYYVSLNQCKSYLVDECTIQNTLKGDAENAQ